MRDNEIVGETSITFHNFSFLVLQIDQSVVTILNLIYCLGSCSKEKIKCDVSVALSTKSLTLFRNPAACQKSFALGQFMNKCHLFFAFEQQKSHSCGHVTPLQAKFCLVGRQFLSNLHKKCLNFGGMLSCQMFFQSPVAFG